MHDFTPFYSPYAPALLAALLPFIIVLAIWSLAIKGYALWHAARNNQREWFIALLIINSVGVLEIIYLVWFRKSSADEHPHAHHEHHTH